MKEKIFSLSQKILSFLPLSWKTESEISNMANLVYLTFKEGWGHTLRHQGLLNISLDFVENYLFKEEANKKILKLKGGLDDSSRNIVDKIIRRHIYIYTHNLLDNKEIIDPSELKSQKIIEAFCKKQADYCKICTYPETFFYHSGLKLLPEATIKKLCGKDVIDGGAFIGDSAIIFSKEYLFRNIYSFEPDRFNYAKLKENLSKYKIKNAIPINRGISSQEGKLPFQIKGVASLIISEGSEEIEVTTVDKYLETQGPHIDIGLIKFDIEGAEFGGVVGALDTIKKFRPALLISIYHTGKDFFEIKPLLESLDLGYQFEIKKLNPSNPVGEVMLIAHVA